MKPNMKLPGLLCERMPSGAYRYRVRPKGMKSVKITMPVSPDHEMWFEHYKAARRGERFEQITPSTVMIEKSLGWLVEQYIKSLDASLSAGLLHSHTVYMRKLHLGRLVDYDDYKDKHLEMPRHAVVKWRDAMMQQHGPATANQMVKAVSAMYSWSIDHGHMTTNPAIGLKKLRHEETGATAWTLDQIKQFFGHHKPGTTPHMWLTLSLITACRIGDAITLGVSNIDNGRLRYQPQKSGSTFVDLPIPPMLDEAIRACDGYNTTTFVHRAGKPFTSVSVACSTVARWVRDAGIEANLTAHGVRKAAAEIMAQSGETQYALMSVMAHSSPTVSSVYTKRVERRNLAERAVETITTTLASVGHAHANPLMLMPPDATGVGHHDR